MLFSDESVSRAFGTPARSATPNTSGAKRDDKPAKSSHVTRRALIKTSLALAAGTLVAPSLLGGVAAEGKTKENSDDLKIAPQYYPLKHFRPQIRLAGKLAVITGASRGIGRAVGESLAALGVDVIGTSRDPANVPNPPAFPLLALDITDPDSVFAFVGALLAHPTFGQHGRVDILANNAARFVGGQIIPLPPTDFLFYLAQRDLGLRTLYSGHVTMTNVMLPLMSQQGYSRIIFTVSIDSYLTGATMDILSLEDTYHSGKMALRAYANNLDSALRAAGSSIRVSTVNPYLVKTGIFTHPNPIYTQPVNDSGLSDTDPIFNAALTWAREVCANGLPPSMVGETYAQLLGMRDPEQNVVVASPREPLATQGMNAFVEPQFLAENQMSAVPFKS